MSNMLSPRMYSYAVCIESFNRYEDFSVRLILLEVIIKSITSSTVENLLFFWSAVSFLASTCFVELNCYYCRVDILSFLLYESYGSDISYLLI